ncbi:MAG: methionyl-tRNA formyltransferase [FCB group bacterium]|nr:methionyl-tRNA formyltransferase [FCB group bacterium]
MGTPGFACPPLEFLNNSRHNIQAVVTLEDKPVGRGKKITSTEVCDKALQLGLPVLRPASLKDESFYQTIKKYDPDLIVTIAFKILPERIFTLPRYGSVNIHASLLPKYRGAAPINWVLINGEKETGLTSFFLKKKVDTGNIILQEKISILENDNYDSLAARLSQVAGPFLLRTIDLIEQGKAVGQIQDDSQATTAPKITPFDAMIDFGFPAEKVKNFIRGLSSKPGAYTFFRGKKLKILACQVDNRITEKGIRPGTILADKKRLLVQCAHSAIEVTSLIPEGKKQMDGTSFINGFKPQRGEILGEISKESV